MKKKKKLMISDFIFSERSRDDALVIKGIFEQ